MIVGDKGKMFRHRLIPDVKAREFGKPPRVLERSPGHYVEWINACKGGKPAGSELHRPRGASGGSGAVGQHRDPHRRKVSIGTTKR